MGYKIDNRNVNLFFKKPNMIASHKGYRVYKFRGQVLVLFDGDVPMDRDFARYLTSINTRRILLPRNLLFYNDKLKGFVRDIVPKRVAGGRLIGLPKDNLLDNIRILEDDAELLGNKNVLLIGVNPDNSIFNGNLYLVNPTGYNLFDGCSDGKLGAINKYQLQLLFREIMTSEFRKSPDSRANIARLRELFELKDDDVDCSTFFDGILDKGESVKQFVKKIDRS